MKKLLLISMMAVLPMIVNAYDFMVNGVAYKVLSMDNLEVEVTVGCEADNDGKLTIPATVEYKGRTFKVLGVGDKPLMDAIVKNTLYDLTIEEGPTYIGGGAFQGQQLTTIKIPKTITVLRDGAFEGNNWYMTSLLDTRHNPISVIIEDGEEMLTYNYTSFATTPLDNNVKYLYLGRNVNNYVLSGALDNVEDFVIGDLVTELTTESLTHLSTSLYNVKNITIGKGLSVIPYMKEGDMTEKIYVRTMKPQNSLGFNDGTFIRATLYVPQGSKEAYMNADVWKNFWTIEEYDLENPGGGPNTNDENANEFYVNALGYRVLSQEDLTCEVFSGNHGSEVHVPGEVTYGGKTYKVLGIGEEAFKASNITALSMDNSLTYIRERACAICPELRKVTIPPSVVYLGEGAFGGCSKLETFIIEDGDEMLEHKLNNTYFYTFASEGPLKTVYIGRNFSKDIFAGGCCQNITDLTIGDHVTIFELTDFPSLLKLTIGKGLISLPYMETGDYLTQIIVNATTPISCGGFNNRTYLNAMLYVPYNTKTKYMTAAGWSNFFDIVEMDAVEGDDVLISISSAKQVPYCSDRNLDFSDLPDLKAYVATGYDKVKGTIWLTRVKQVPAETGFLLLGEPGDYDIPTIDGVSDVYYKNMFKGTLTGTTIQTTEGDYTNYYLSKGTSGVGFYKVTNENGQKIGANRCYLPILTDIPAGGSEGDAEVIKVSAAKQVPYYTSKNIDFTSLDAQGVKAYTATGYNYTSGVIWLTRVKKVPAQTGILVMADKEGEYSVPTISVQSVYENMFTGSETAQTIYTTEMVGDMEYINYYLSNGASGIGFYKVTKEDGVSMGANRSYLQIPKRDAAGARGISDNASFSKMVISDNDDDVIAVPLFTGDATGISDVLQRVGEEEVYYNLQGQRVDRPGKGIYIKNGKKVVIK